LVKRGESRPRPYLYLPDASPDRGASNVGFESFPSGHSSQAWCSASFAVVDHMYSRPRASWRENAAVGFVGGALAAVTGYMRVRAGQQLPERRDRRRVAGDVFGAVVPLVHHYIHPTDPGPDRRMEAWLQSLAGAVAGSCWSWLPDRRSPPRREGRPGRSPRVARGRGQTPPAWSLRNVPGARRRCGWSVFCAGTVRKGSSRILSAQFVQCGSIEQRPGICHYSTPGVPVPG